MHVAQLAHLLPEALSLEWVKLPVAAHSSRTEAHLLVTLDAAAAGAAGVDAGAAPSGGELQAARHLLHCRLAGHLLGSYREHLAARAAEARAAGDEAAAEELEAAAAAAADPPVKQWVPPYPEGAADVPQLQLPQRPDAPTPSRGGGSPAVLAGAAAAAAALPATPATGVRPLPSATASRHGRPPVHPSTVDRQRAMQRRLSFGAAAAAGAVAATPKQTKPREPLAAAPGQAQASARRRSTPLDKLAAHLDAAAPPAGGLGGQPQLAQAQQQQQQQEQQQVHASQAALAAALEGEQWGGSILSQEDAALLAGMPEELRRMSTDGIISLDTLRVRCCLTGCLSGVWCRAVRRAVGLGGQQACSRRAEGACCEWHVVSVGGDVPFRPQHPPASSPLPPDVGPRRSWMQLSSSTGG